MSELALTLATTQSLLVAPLIKGEVKPHGVSLRIEVAKNIDESSRRVPKLDYDLVEADLATYVRAREDRVPVLALPIFSSGRKFFHRGIQWSGRAGIRDLHDLPGRAAVTPQYWLASSVWQRKLLGMAYRVDPEGISWVTLQAERLPNMSVPSGVMHRLETVGRNAEELARTGSTDILLLPEATGPAFENRRISGMPPAFVPAFPDPEKAEREYYQQSSIFPITNVLVIREEVVQKEPDVVEPILRAYAEAKHVAQRREQTGNAPQPGPGETTRWMKELMGDDPWAYGLSANRKPLDSFLAAARAQLLLIHRFELEELFAPNLPPDFA